jgi:hypothetical protein
MISNLTNGMNRLSDEISVLRHNRAELRNGLVLGRSNLEKTVSEMIAGFQRDRKEMGEQTKTDVAEFMRDLRGVRAAWFGSAVVQSAPPVLSEEH